MLSEGIRESLKFDLFYKVRSKFLVLCSVNISRFFVNKIIGKKSSKYFKKSFLKNRILDFFFVALIVFISTLFLYLKCSNDNKVHNKKNDFHENHNTEFSQNITKIVIMFFNKV